MPANKRPKVLIVDDDLGIRELLMEILTDEGYTVITAANADAAWQIRLEQRLSLVLLDIWMPGKDGLTLLKQWKDAGLADMPIIVMSGHATIDTAVEAVKIGALEVLEKPIATNRLLVAMQNALNTSYNECGNPNIVRTNFGKSQAIKKFKQQLLDSSAGSRPVLFVAPPSAGASFFAQLLAKPKMPVMFLDNPSQLEGNTEKILREANGGILILRLIDMLNPIQQNGLLALVREAGRMEVRIIAASMASPKELERDKGYNKLLLGTFSSHIIRMPSLSQYIEDIPYIVDIITRQLTVNTDMVGRQFMPQAVNLLSQHYYENDFIELLSLVRSALMYAESDKVNAATMQVIINQFSLNSSLKGVRGDIFSMTLRDARLCFEREYLRRIMQVTHGNIQQAAQIAGMERTYLYRKLKQHEEI